jgi:hypothetical protein
VLQGPPFPAVDTAFCGITADSVTVQFAPISVVGTSWTRPKICHPPSFEADDLNQTDVLPVASTDEIRASTDLADYTPRRSRVERGTALGSPSVTAGF